MKPVAWMSPDGKVSQTEGKLFHIPLYAVSKPLSNDEILDLWMELIDESLKDIKVFARAIEEKHGIKSAEVLK